MPLVSDSWQSKKAENDVNFDLTRYSDWHCSGTAVLTFSTKVLIDSSLSVEGFWNLNSFIFEQPIQYLWWAEKWFWYYYFVDIQTHSFLMLGFNSSNEVSFD